MVRYKGGAGDAASLVKNNVIARPERTRAAASRTPPPKKNKSIKENPL